MVDGNGYGLNWKGLYDPEVMEHYGNQRHRRTADELSETVKLVAAHRGVTALGATTASTTRWPSNLACELAPGLRRGAGALRRAGHAHPAVQATVDPRRATWPRDDVLTRAWR